MIDIAVHLRTLHGFEPMDSRSFRLEDYDRLDAEHVRLHEDVTVPVGDHTHRWDVDKAWDVEMLAGVSALNEHSTNITVAVTFRCLPGCEQEVAHHLAQIAGDNIAYALKESETLGALMPGERFMVAVNY